MTDPAIEVFARASGRLHWLCPNCHFIHDSTVLNWRRPRVLCNGRWHGVPQCRRSFRLGIWFDNAATSQSMGWGAPPFNALLGKAEASVVTNRLRPAALADYAPAVAHIVGFLEYRCPKANCGKWDRQRLNYLGAVTCPHCHTMWRTGVIFHPPARSVRQACPRDWSVSSESF